MNKSLILVVEDDKSVRNLITTTLKTHEYRYLTAPDGQSAILETSSHNPDIVLLDLGLPDIDGVEIIKKIRTWSNMPIIVISARSEDTDKIQLSTLFLHHKGIHIPNSKNEDFPIPGLLLLSLSLWDLPV